MQTSGVLLPLYIFLWIAHWLIVLFFIFIISEKKTRDLLDKSPYHTIKLQPYYKNTFNVFCRTCSNFQIRATLPLIDVNQEMYWLMQRIKKKFRPICRACLLINSATFWWSLMHENTVFVYGIKNLNPPALSAVWACPFPRYPPL